MPSLTLIEKIKLNVRKLHDPAAELEDVKEIVCTFYQEGHCPQCAGCAQPEDLVQTCRTEYLKRIEGTPMEHWEKKFDAIKPREKKKVHEYVDIGLNCSRCYIADRCPHFMLDHVCAIDFGDDIAGKKLTDVLDVLINLQNMRVRRMAMIEELEGGMPDANLSGEIDRLNKLIESKANVGSEKISINVNASRPAVDPATGEERPRSGMLAGLFADVKRETTIPHQLEAPSFTSHVIPVKSTVKETRVKEKSKKK